MDNSGGLGKSSSAEVDRHGTGSPRQGTRPKLSRVQGVFAYSLCSKTLRPRQTYKIQHQNFQDKSWNSVTLAKSCTIFLRFYAVKTLKYFIAKHFSYMLAHIDSD